MYVSVVGVIKNSSSDDILGYRILDVDDGRVKDVTPDQLKAVLYKKTLSISNVAVRKNTHSISLYGIYYSMSILPLIYKDKVICESNKLIVLATVNNSYLICDCTGNYKLFNRVEVANLRRLGRIINPLDESNHLKCPDASDHPFTFLTKQVTSGAKPVAPVTNSSAKPVQQPQKPKQTYNYGDISSKDSVWDTNKFTSYMNENGYTFSILDSAGNRTRVNQLPSDKNIVLCDVSPNCKSLHLPKGVKAVLNLFNTAGLTELNLDTLVINSDIESIAALTNNNCNVTIKNLIFQSDYTASANDMVAYIQSKTSSNNVMYVPKRHMMLASNAFNKVTVTENLIIPFNKELFGLFNDSNISNIDIKSSKRFINCFNRSHLGNSEINTDDLDYLGRCFNNSNGITKLTVSTRMLEITDSFSETDISSIDFSNARKLNKLGRNSFSKNQNITEVDLSGCERLVTMVDLGVFENCPRLERVKLSPKAGYVRGIFDKCPVAEMDIPESCYGFSWTINNLHAYLMGKTIQAGVLSGFDAGKGHSIELNDVEVIEKGAFSCKKGVLNGKIYPSIKMLEPSAFLNYPERKFSTECIPSVEYIPDKAFEQSLVEEVIFADSVKKIGAQVFYDCNSVSKVVLGPSVEEIDSKFLDKMQTPKIIKIYVLEGTFAHKYYKNKKKGVDLIVKSSMDEINAELGISKQDERQNAKFKIALPGSKYEYLLNEPYNKYIAKLMQVIRAYESAEMMPNVILNESKFKDLDLSNMGEVKHEADIWRNSVDYIGENFVIDPVTHDVLKYSKQFASISNMLTTMLDNYEPMYNEVFVRSIGTAPLTMELIYCDRYNVIAYCRSIGLNNRPVFWLVIVMDNKVKFMTPFNMEELYIMADTIKLVNKKRYDANMVTRKYSLGNTFVVGDVLNAESSTVNGAPMPGNVRRMIREYANVYYGDPIFISNNFIYVGGARKMMRQNAVSPKGVTSSEEIMLYDTIAQSFITLKTLATYQGYGVDDNHRKFIHYAKQFGASSITGIYKLSEYDKIPDKFKEQMNNAVNESNNIRAIKAHTMSDDELSAFYTAPGAFDKDGDLNMCSFADQIQIIARDVKSIIKPGLVPAIVSLGLAKPFSKSIYEVSDNQNFTLNGTLKFEDDAHTEIVEYKFYKEDCVMYLIGEITKDTNINKRGVLNESVCSLMNIATALYCIGKYRKDIGDTLEPYNGITNDKVEPDRFHFLRSQSYSSRGRVKISLALDKLNCDPYLIGEVFDTDFYTLLRFKTIRDAMDFFDKAVLQYTDIHYGWSNLVNGIANGITMSDSDTLVARPRSLILRGLPNGYPTVEDSLGIFDILAKQPNNKI